MQYALRSRLRRGTSVSILLVAALLLPAQEVATFKSTSNLVIVNVSVKDKSGKPITNLKKEDFALFEDDKPQSVSVFELQKLDAEVLPALAQGPRTFKERVERPKPAAPAPGPAGTIRFQDKRLIGMLFDFSSMAPAEQARAQEAAIKFLSTQMTAADLVSVMTFTSQFKVVEEFTADREALIETIKGFRLGESSELAVDGNTPDPNDDSDDGSLFVADETEFNIFNTDRKLTALETAAKKLAMFPEKKALVYFSSGVSKTGVENQAQLRATINAAVRANVAFYPVDARGLVAMAPAGDASAASPRGSGVFSGRTQTSAATSFMTSKRRCTVWQRTPAARLCSIPTTSPSGSRKRRKTLIATTSWAITAPIRRWTAASARSGSSWRASCKPSWITAPVTTPRSSGRISIPPTKSGSWRRRCSWVTLSMNSRWRWRSITSA